MGEKLWTSCVRLCVCQEGKGGERGGCEGVMERGKREEEREKEERRVKLRK